jgi:hypothetical protein
MTSSFAQLRLIYTALAQIISFSKTSRKSPVFPLPKSLFIATSSLELPKRVHPLKKVNDIRRFSQNKMVACKLCPKNIAQLGIPESTVKSFIKSRDKFHTIFPKRGRPRLLINIETDQQGRDDRHLTFSSCDIGIIPTISTRSPSPI